MKNKINLLITTIFLFAFISSLTAESKEVRYITGYIKNVDNNLITLTSNLAFRANEHVTAVSMTPAVFVLEKDRPEGFVYIKGRKVDVTLMKKSGSKYVLPASKQDYQNYTIGNLEQLKTVSAGTAMIELTNGEEWMISDKDEVDTINNWREGDWVIITKPQHSGSEIIINTRTTGKISVSKSEEITTAE